MVLEAPQRSLIAPGLHIPPVEAFTRVSYDPAEDTLIVRTEESAAALSEPLDDGVWVRVELDGHRVVGFDVEGYTETFLPEHEALATVIKAVAGHIDNPDVVAIFWLAARVGAAAATSVDA